MRITTIFLLLVLALSGQSSRADSLPKIDDILIGDLPAGWTLTVFGGEGTAEEGVLLFSLNFSSEPYNIIGHATWGDIVRVPKQAIELDNTPSYTLYALKEPVGESFFYVRKGATYSVVIRVSDADARVGMRLIAAFAGIEVQ